MRPHILAVVSMLTLLGGCVQDPLPSATPTVLDADAIQLPPRPRHTLSVGVFNCIDTTGQRRPTGQAQELSSAVPMDCTPYLVEAVLAMTPGYLRLVERQHVDELMRERQLATLALSQAARTAAEKHILAVPNKLNSLQPAEILLEGQVVAYDRQTREVSAGLAFGGNGGDLSIITDTMTFSLRAVSVRTGLVLGESMVTKSITSQKEDGYMNKIWNTAVMVNELTASGNEPVGLALRLACRSALKKLVSDGIKAGWWS